MPDNKLEPPFEAPRWSSPVPDRCQLCNETWADAQSMTRHPQTPMGKTVMVFIDGATRQGPWGLMCVDCHLDHGRGLGLGRGQMYLLAAPHLKIRG